MSLTRFPRVRVLVAAAIGLTSALILGGCAAVSGPGPSPHPTAASPVPTTPIQNYVGEPKDVEAPPTSAGGAPFSVWLEDGSQFTVTFYGSSSCPPIPSSLTVEKDNRLTINFPEADESKKCTMDYTPHTTVFMTPAAIDPHQDVIITGQGVRFTLPSI